MFHPIDIWNVRLGNALYVDLKITLLKKFPSHQKIIRDGKVKYVFNEKVHSAWDNGKNNYDHKIYASMARMYSNDKCSSKKYGDSSQLTYWILYSGSTCQMTPEVPDLPGSLEYMDN